ncbi:MAG: DUF1003 domain-containing protein [Dietzia sp.]
MTEPGTRSALSTPVTSRRPRISVDPDAVGRYSEAIARFFGTGQYLMIQTILVIVWILINVTVVALRFDPYPFILLNLAFSTQAAYAAPLILLAQNRQEDRDKESIAEDRLRATQTKADTEFLARELASVRLSVGETVTRDYLRRELDDLRHSVERIETLLAGQNCDDGNTERRKTDSDTRGRR